MKTVVILDDSCPQPYSYATLQSSPMGGTEATAVRVAEGLAPKYKVHVWQHNRTNAEVSPTGVEYTNRKPVVADFVIRLRIPGLLADDRKRYPNAKLVLWLHDLPNIGVTVNAQIIADTRAHVICVSRFHLLQVRDFLMREPVKGIVRSSVIYNPIDESLTKDTTTVKANKLVFFSSPHKGLDYTLKLFQRLADFPEVADSKLYIANPGYFQAKLPELERVVNLESLPHGEVITHVREALCVFHLNHVFPETFGLVHAEANAVGTPFLTHDFGANAEVSDHPHQLVNTRNPKEVIDTLIRWRSGGRPKVFAKDEFRLNQVLKQWEKILC